MERKLLQKLIAVILVFCLTATNFIFVATSAVYALSATSELEGGKVIFEAYFKEADKKVTEKTANISEGASLYLNLQLKAGKIQNAKIKIDNANFKIVEDKVSNKFINNINSKTNEISLNEISYNDSKNGIIEIELPIKFEEAKTIPTSYFAMENTISLSGKYINSSENGKEIKSNPIKTKLTWTEGKVSVGWNGKIEKIITLGKKVIVQANIESKYTEGYFPKETEKVTINVPKVEGVTPTYTILVNGDKLDKSQITDNVTTQDISFTNNFKDGDKISWNKSGDIYKVIYVYEGIEELEEPIQLNPTIETKIYGREELKSKVLSFKSNKPQGSIASVNAKSTSEKVYKGYMYANSEETTYSEEYNMEISYVDGITGTLELEEDNFKTQNGEKISTNNKTEYKEIKINKEKLVKVLGTKGSVKIVPDNKKLSEITIDSTSSADDDGNIVIDSEKIKGSHNVAIKILSAENEGTIKISVEKAIKGNAGYDKDTLRTINAIETTVKAYTNDVETTSTNTATTELKETVTEATLTMNNNNVLSTTSTNNVEFIATLKTGTMDTDLLKSPTIKIVLPTEVTKTQITSVSALYAEKELKIASSKVEDDNKAILIKLDGEQIKYNNKVIEGIKVTVNAKITLNEMATSRDTKIEMKYTNENSAQKEYKTTTDVSIQAPFGLITRAKANTHFEKANEGVETLSATIVNNYGKAIENIALIGTMPTKAITQDNFKTNLENVKVEIKYSKDGKVWEDENKEAKLFKITLANSKINNGDRFAIALKMDVSKVLSTFKLSYMYEGLEKIQDLQINDLTSDTAKEEAKEEPAQQSTDNKEQGLNVTMTAKTSNMDIKDGSEVVAGEVIRFNYTISNNSSKDIENAKLLVNHENANIFEGVTQEQANSVVKDEILKYTFEQETQKSNKEFALGTIKAGTKQTVEYQVRVKENASQTKTDAKVTAKDITDVTLNSITNKVNKAELKLELTNNVSKEYAISAGKIFANTFSIKNISDQKQNDIEVRFTIPSQFEYCEIYEAEQNNNFKIVQADKNYLVFKVNELAAGATKDMIVSLKVVDEKPQENQKIQYNATVNENTYYSNELTVNTEAIKTSKIQAIMTSNMDDTVQTGDKLVYTLTMKNVGEDEDSLIIKDSVPEAATITKAYYTKGTEQTKVEPTKNNSIITSISLKSQEVAKLTIETQIDEEKTGDETITNFATIGGQNLKEEVKTNEVSHKLKANISTPQENPSSEEPATEPQPSVPGNVDVKVSISGVAWLDADKNGNREATEKLLPGIKVSLADISTGKNVTDTNGNKLEVTTGEDGKYKFENISSGKYIVIFTYDNTKYRNTQYKASGASENTNSDIITSKLSANNDEIKYGVTDTIEISGNSLQNIDAGFIENEVFDLSLRKYITKVTVQNSSGTVVKQYSNEQLAKLEIDAKNLAHSTVLVEYKIEIKNEGEIAGYANEIVDYMPQDLTFSSEINKDWYVSTDGNAHTTSLAKELINPGETKSVTLTLVKTMTESNTGLTSNKAEIAKSSNELSIPDKDSKAGNNIQGEDDISTAELIISVRTGVEFTIGIIIALIALATTGIVVYTKKRKEANHE